MRKKRIERLQMTEEKRGEGVTKKTIRGEKLKCRKGRNKMNMEGGGELGE